MFKNFSPFFETYNEIKGWLESNGMMEKFRQNNITSRREPEELGPQVLTMDHLRLGFLACLIVAAVSVAAFIGELIWSRLVIAFKANIQNVFEKKREIVIETVSVDGEMSGSVYDLIEVHSIAVENSMVVEDVKLESMNEVVVQSEMCEDEPVENKPNHPEIVHESQAETDSIDELIEALILKAPEK